MTPDLDRIVVEVPASDSRRDQIERKVFEQLAALRIADRVDAVVPAERHHRAWVGWLAVATVVATACVVLVIAVGGHDDVPVQLPVSPSFVQTPVGGSSRFTVADAVIDAGSDTSVRVQQDPTGGVALVLSRGSVDCDVEPRGERPPFRVVAGDVTVVVVGTRFTVSRHDANVRVEVARGKVSVTSPSGERFVAVGEVWSSEASGDTASAAPQPPPVDVPPPLPVPSPTVAPPPSSHVAFVSAQRLEAHDRAAAARGYRSVANGKDSWAALALYSLAELESARHRTDAALAALDEYQRRFVRGANAEDAAWLRVDVVRAAGRDAAVRAAAEAYVRAFPNGTYVKAANRLAGAAP